MENTISLSEETYTALQQKACIGPKPIDSLVDSWVRQHLNLDNYSDLEWRQGVGGWRIGVKGTAIDVYTVVGFFKTGCSPREIADEMLPGLSLGQVHSALRNYTEFPDEIDQIIADGEAEQINARLYRALGPEGYRRLTGKLD